MIFISKSSAKTSKQKTGSAYLMYTHPVFHFRSPNSNQFQRYFLAFLFTSFFISNVAQRWIAPSTPPPPSRLLFAAFMIASRSSTFVISPLNRLYPISHNYITLPERWSISCCAICAGQSLSLIFCFFQLKSKYSTSIS